MRQYVCRVLYIRSVERLFFSFSLSLSFSLFLVSYLQILEMDSPYGRLSRESACISKVKNRSPLSGTPVFFFFSPAFSVDRRRGTPFACILLI